MNKLKQLKYKIQTNSLYRNSAYLLINNIVLAGFGMIFWGINSRLYNPTEIGIASTLISSGSLITVFSLMGLNVSIIRYLPKSQHKNHIINSSLTIVGITSLLASIIFLIGLQYFSPELSFLHNHPFYVFCFILFVTFTAYAELIKNTFRAYLAAQYVLLKNLIFNILKIITVLFFVSHGAFGIFGSWTLSLIIAIVITAIILIKKFEIRFKLTLNLKAIKQMTSFSFANYISEFFERTPRLILPIIITSTISSAQAAYFYIDITLAGFLFLLPEAVSNSFFAEGSTKEHLLKLYIKQVTKVISAFMLPSIIFVSIFGKYILLYFGKAYSEQGHTLLSILAFSAIFIAINSILGNVARIKYQIKTIVTANFIGALSIISLSLLLIPYYSILGVGYAWITGQAFTSLFYITAILWNNSS